MGTLRTIGLVAAVAGVTAAGLAIGSGRPPQEDPSAPAPDTVVAHGSAQSAVAEPAKRTNMSVEREVRAARARAIPRAVALARTEAATLAEAAGLPLGDPVGIARDAAPAGWYDQESGRFGPGRWCGPISTSRIVERGDGRTERVRESHHGCHKPTRVSVQVTVTFAAGRD